MFKSVEETKFPEYEQQSLSTMFQNLDENYVTPYSEFQEIDENNITRSSNNSGFLENSYNALKIKFEPEATEISKQYLLEMIQHCYGKATIEVNFKGFSDSIKASTQDLTEKITKDPNVVLKIEKANKSNLDKSLCSEFSDESDENAETIKTIKVEFKKTSDLIILQLLMKVNEKIKGRIHTYASKKNVEIKLLAKGYLLSGKYMTALNEIKESIEQEHNRFLSIKIFKNTSNAEIDAESRSLLQIKNFCYEKLNLKFFYLMPSAKYLETYQEVAEEVPELKEKLPSEKEKINLRIILYQSDNIKENKEIKENFFRILKEDFKKFSKTFPVVTRKIFTDSEIKGFKKVAATTSEEKIQLYCHSEKINKGESWDTNIEYKIGLLAYFKNQEERDYLQEKAKQIEKKIRKIISTIKSKQDNEFSNTKDSKNNEEISNRREWDRDSGRSFRGRGGLKQLNKNNFERKIPLPPQTQERRIIREQILDIPSYSIQELQKEKNFISDLQKKNDIKITIIEPSLSLHINFITGIEDQSSSKKLILVKGCGTKLNVDAIVNYTNPVFDNDNMTQKIGNIIADKARNNEVNECLKFGKLIININPLKYREDQSPASNLFELRQLVNKILQESGGMEKLAVPMLKSKPRGFPLKETITVFVEELAKGLFQNNSSLKEIYIVEEFDNEKIHFLKEKMDSIAMAKLDEDQGQFKKKI